MSKPCKAFHIDAVNKTVTEVEYDGNYQSIYKYLSGGGVKVDTFDIVYLNNKGDTLYVDDNGLLHSPMIDHWFHWKGYQSLAGNGLILGSDEEGDSVSPQMTLDEVKTHVTFKDFEAVRKEVMAQ